MASVGCPGLWDIDYSVVDGRVRSFEIDGVTLYDERLGIAASNWGAILVALIKTQRLDVDRDGHGLHAFVRPFLDKHGEKV